MCGWLIDRSIACYLAASASLSLSRPAPCGGAGVRTEVLDTAALRIRWIVHVWAIVSRPLSTVHMAHWHHTAPHSTAHRQGSLVPQLTAHQLHCQLPALRTARCTGRSDYTTPAAWLKGTSDNQRPAQQTLTCCITQYLTYHHPTIAYMAVAVVEARRRTMLARCTGRCCAVAFVPRACMWLGRTDTSTM